MLACYLPSGCASGSLVLVHAGINLIQGRVVVDRSGLVSLGVGSGNTSRGCGRVGGGVAHRASRCGGSRVCGSTSCTGGMGVVRIVRRSVGVGVGVVFGPAEGILDLVDDGRHDDRCDWLVVDVERLRFRLLGRRCITLSGSGLPSLYRSQKTPSRVLVLLATGYFIASS